MECRSMIRDVWANGLPLPRDLQQSFDPLDLPHSGLLVSTLLPPISYLTTLDPLMLGAMALVLFAALESLYVYQLLHRAGEANGQRATELARRLDRTCLAASPLLMRLALVACYTR
jgi:hypothetical protein